MPWVLVLVVVVFTLTGVAATVSASNQVRHIERAAGCDLRLTAALALYSAHGPVPILVTSGVRTPDEQLVQWAKGREGDVIVDATAVVTYAKTANDSSHIARTNGGNAFDFAVLIDGVPMYGDVYRPLYEPAILFFENLGLVCGARWVKRFPPNGDFYHVETPDWKTQPMLPEVNV